MFQPRIAALNGLPRELAGALEEMHLCAVATRGAGGERAIVLRQQEGALTPSAGCPGPPGLPALRVRIDATAHSGERPSRVRGDGFDATHSSGTC